MSVTMKPGEFYKIRTCRLCLDFERKENLLIVGNKRLFKMLKYCIGLKIKSNDEPKLICKKCSNSLSNFVKFKKRCLKSNSLWKSLTSDTVCLIENITVQSKTEIDNIGVLQMIPNEADIKKAIIHTSHIKDEETNNFNTNNIDICYDANENDNNDMIVDETLNNTLDDTYSTEEPMEMIPSPKTANKSKHNTTVKRKLANEFACKSCNKIFSRKWWFVKHVKICSISEEDRQKNEDKQNYLCGLCRYASCNVEEVNKHFLEHIQRNDLECQLCSYIGFDFAQMIGHRICHNTRNSVIKLFCPVCNHSYKTPYSTEYHYRSLHLNKNGGFCPKCNLEFTDFPKFRHHMLTHSDSKYICDICNKSFRFRKNIIRHLNNHREPNKFVCYVCGKRFQRSNYLKVHISNVHVKGDPIKCEHCDKYFKSESTLKHHMRRYLEKSSSLTCDVCGKCFAKPHELKRHKFWHTGERPHCCEICGSRYKAKGQLKVHLQKHSGLRPFKCDSCSKCFALPTELKRHFRVHSGIRPYKCLHCDRTFNAKNIVLKHCALVHKLIDAIDKDCYLLQ